MKLLTIERMIHELNNHTHAKPIPPTELRIYQILQKRKKLTVDDQRNVTNLKVGYEGEKEFFAFLHRLLPAETLLLHSLQLSHNGSEFQIDSLLIWQNTIYLFDVKNFTGDFYIQGKNWFVSPSGKEINNPLIQLSRAESLLRQLILRLGFNFDIQAHLVFINPEFALFQAPLHFPIIFRAQLNRFFRNFVGAVGIPRGDSVKFAQALIDQHLVKSSYERLPQYTFEELKKGIFCPECSKRMYRINRNNFACGICSKKEGCGTLITEAVNEVQTLFPSIKTSTNLIYLWMGGQISQNTIWRHMKINKSSVASN